ncbi:HAMP domain-containing protein [Anaerocolumna sedimenticola]|uniref:HAMP domain-containing protein n=1 Tax=Anaerocolumna sedimenticola TaxID=2696063 RepID=A0A6P1TSD9_9FIRM|nr:sensor histidine kinase [Anaerocolumna sedimenticola]QHQ63182.1 HAMP domain-containing protein [Anaerocolumna sedimenticola]
MKGFWLKTFGNLKLNVKIRLYFGGIIAQFCLVALLLFTNLVKYNREYNQIVQSATTASGFSIDFKSDFDYKMYRIIIGSEAFKEAKPYEDIEAAQKVALDLQLAARTAGNKDRAEGIHKFLNNLKKHVHKIEDNLKETGHYDENISILDNDIRVLTSLIQDTVLEYIYYDTLDMESVRITMEKQTLKTVELSVIMLTIMIGGALFFSVIISNSISRPIKELSGITGQVAKGDLSVRSHIKKGAEVKVLSDSLNIMIEKLSELIETVKIEQANLREAELKLLQAQINPHFLYNTLDTIIWLAEADKGADVVDMVGALSNYFRTSLSKGNDRISLKEEELHVRSYLQIQQSRYKDILEYEINIPGELGDCLVPKITLQPLVENALYHGIKNKRGKGKIIISGDQDGRNIRLLIQDNGLGMSKERLKQVLEALNKKDKGLEKNFYGLYNVNERIQLYYGKEYGLKIKSRYQVGTEVEVILPAEYKADIVLTLE